MMMLAAMLFLFFPPDPGLPRMSGQLSVAAAADLNFAMKEMIVPFQRQTGYTLKLTLGSSGNFYGQIVNGAPYDMFFSADLSYPKKLAEAGLAVADTLTVYAIGRLVLWAPNGSRIDPARTGMQALADPSIRKIAIANPVHAPYGRAAVAAMEHFNIYQRIRDKLVSGESVLQAAQFVQSGAADIGLIPLSLALAPPMRHAGSYWTIPQETYPKIEQGAVILNHARKSGSLAAALSFLDWIRGPQGRDILARFGFALPEGGIR